LRKVTADEGGDEEVVKEVYEAGAKLGE